MKILTRCVASVLGALLLASCSTAPEMAAASTDMGVCVISGEPVDADSPSVDYMGQTVRFCCKRCKGKFEAMDDAGKKATLAKK
jgi:YHS domain-containing protein